MSPSESSQYKDLPPDTLSEVETKTTTATTTSITTSTPSTSKQQSSHERKSLQIFLGGSCNPTTWRQSVAIPYLEMNGITYYNPQVDDWTPEVVKIERNAKQSAQVLLFVIDKQTRSTVSLVESAFMAGDDKNLVLVIYPFDYDILSLTDTTTKQTSNIVETRSELTSLKRINKRQNESASVLQSSSTSSSSTLVTKQTSGIIRINDEIISLGEFQELSRARFLLQKLATKLQIPIFSDLSTALSFVSNSLKKNEDNKFAHSNSDNNLDHKHNIYSMIGDDLPKDVALKDVYLTVDDSDEENNLRSTIIPILEEKGLSFDCMPVKNFIESCVLMSANSTTNVPSLPRISQISTNTSISMTKNQQNYSSRYSAPLGDTKTESPPQSLKEQQQQGQQDVVFGNGIQGSRVLLFVITNKCRGLSIMVLASHFMALFRNNVVLCIQYLEEPCSIGGETLTKSAIADYNRGRVYLCDYAIKSRVPVFSSIGEAIDCCSRKCGSHKNRRDS